MKNKLWIRLVAAMVLVLVSRSAHAFFTPSFHLDTSAWSSTHVLVVSSGNETVKGDRRVRVIESWRGDVKPGEELDIPGLEFLSQPERLRVIKAGEATGRVVGTSRMILFLKREKKLWKPAGMQDSLTSMRITMAWVSRGEAFADATMGAVNTPIGVGSIGTERSVRRKVLLANRFASYLADKSGKDELERMLELLRGPFPAASQLAAQRLLEGSKEQIVALEELLLDPTLPSLGVHSISYRYSKKFPDRFAKLCVRYFEVERERCSKAKRHDEDRVTACTYVLGFFERCAGQTDLRSLQRLHDYWREREASGDTSWHVERMLSATGRLLGK